jgi:hypothetical protein
MTCTQDAVTVVGLSDKIVMECQWGFDNVTKTEKRMKYIVG